MDDQTTSLDIEYNEIDVEMIPVSVGDINPVVSNSKIRKNSTETLVINPLSEKRIKTEHNNNPDICKIMDDVKLEKDSESNASSEDEERKFVNKNCLNDRCNGQSKFYYIAPLFVKNHYGIRKNVRKRRYACEICFEVALMKYKVLTDALVNQEDLFTDSFSESCKDLVEISDSEEEIYSSDDDTPLSSDTIEMIATSINEVINDTLEKYGVHKIFKSCMDEMIGQNEKNEDLSNKIIESHNKILKDLKEMSNSLYSQHQPYHDMPAVDITDDGVRPLIVKSEDANKSANTSPNNQINIRDAFPKLCVGSTYYAVKKDLLDGWIKCKIKEIFRDKDGANFYKVEYISEKPIPPRILSGKHLAYSEELRIKLTTGTRVIAKLNSDSKTYKSSVRNRFLPGIIAEPLQRYNSYRYLIFFDDGYAQYALPQNCRVVCESSANVWEDVHDHSKNYIQNFLINKQEQKPMMQVRQGQQLITETKNTWMSGTVSNVDASLVEIYFEKDNEYEWIYRGSKRLGPIYLDNGLNNSISTQLQKRNVPSIEYITIVDDDDEDTDTASRTMPIRKSDGQPARSVAKKSSGVFNKNPPERPQIPIGPRHMNNSTIFMDDEPKGKVVYYTPKTNLEPKVYFKHRCDPMCLYPMINNLNAYNPLTKPLITGWKRNTSKFKNKKMVHYVAPCGKNLRNIAEVYRYLRTTKSPLNVENFDFDILISCLSEYVIEKSYYSNNDLSEGKEGMAIMCVNYYDDSKPPECVYSTERIPTPGVTLNLDPEFLSGCDCTDGCLNKSKCACWKLTLEGAKYGNPNTHIDNVGYHYKKLHETVPTGIFECNSRCKCNSKCLNRVVQHPLTSKLQVFKTANRGWGIRTLCDIGRGSYVCIYSGHLLTEERSIEICHSTEDKHGDEYYAELDYIEVVEKIKLDYEQNVILPKGEMPYSGSSYETQQQDEDYEEEEEEDQNMDDGLDSDEDFLAPVKINIRSGITTRSRSHSTTVRQSVAEKEYSTETDDDRAESPSNSSAKPRELITLTPKTGLPGINVSNFKSTREMFGKNERVYIMDAKKSGNIGRYFNHSCNPNLFVQNVFVDTHDVRFPWVSFFAATNIRAGTELTWNYNYDVGSVPDKYLVCQCGASNCRKRLL